MTIQQIKKYWADANEKLHTYELSQLDHPWLLSTTKDFLINGGLPDSCVPGLSFDDCTHATIPTPNEIFNLDLDELNNYLVIGSNDFVAPICIDLNNDNEIVYLDYDRDFERVFMNSSILQLAECIIRYTDFYSSLNTGIEENTFLKRKFSDEELKNLCDEFKQIDNKCLLENYWWKMELDCLTAERDNT